MSAMDTLKRLAVFSVASTVMLIGCPTLGNADTAIETETAQIGKKGDFGFSQSYEYAHAKDGTSGGTLTQFEYAFSDRFEILIEPFFYTWEHAEGDEKVHGLGDLEITPSYEIVQENGWVPAVLAAFKLKVPTGSEEVGSSGKFDYLPYLIFGQHFGAWTFNANFGVNIVTPADGEEKYRRTFTWALEAEREIAPDWTAFFEVFSTEDNVKTVSTALEYKLNEHFNAFGAAGYTEDNEAIFRLGFNLEGSVGP